MSNSEGTLSCTVNLEWKNDQGTILRKVMHKSAHLRLIRNDLRDMFLEVNSDKAAKIKLAIKNINVHKKFMAEGKASIVFQDVKCTVYLSNAPPGNLLGFLKTIFVKMTRDNGKTNLNTSLRTQLLSHNPSAVEEISPVTIAELQNAHKLATRTTDTTPSPSTRKRKLQTSERRKDGPAAKKLYSTSPVPEQLNIEQQQVLDACVAGHNVFFTGSAGTGKSFLLRKIIAALPPDVTIATASTGVAACHIGGVTIHAFAGIGNGECNLQRACQLASKPQTAILWRKCKHLVVDEISMVDGLYFEKIEAVARHVRKSDKPFGGIQLILCGDFLQLPPVIRNSDLVDKTGKERIKFCFQSPVWEKCVQVSYELKIVHRQTDIKFINILNNLRIGKITPEIIEELTKTAKQKIEQDGILATRLCSHTNEADTINKHKLDNIESGEKIFYSDDSNKVYSNILDQQTPVPNKLILKVGAQVMLLKNINVSAGLVNGARGVVIDFKADLPVVKFRNNKIYSAKHEKWIVKTLNGGLIARRQIPLKLAWAFSIHKSQGLTLDCVEMSLSRVFEAGQAYVALSRAQSLETLRVLDFDGKQVWANPDVLNFYRKLRIKMQQTEIIPLGKKKSNLVRTLSKSKIGLFKSHKPLMSIC